MQQKIVLFVATLIAFFNTPTQAQISHGGSPFSFGHFDALKAQVPIHHIAPPNMAILQAEDALNNLPGMAPRMGKALPVDLNLENSGLWETLPNGDRVWRLQVEAPQAQSLVLYYKHFHLPEGASLFVYSPDHRQVLGAFTNQNNKPTEQFATGLLRGDKAVLEYYEPGVVRGKGKIALSHVGYAYRMTQPRLNTSRDFEDSDTCQINSACSEGDNYRNIIRSTVRILVYSGQDLWWCSGTLINNVREDCTPYFLTAEHCAFGADSTDLAKWIFFFNYASLTCDNPDNDDALDNQGVTGATIVSQSDDNGGDTGSDFLLFELSSEPPSEFNVYYAGWNRLDSASSGGVCLHHPSGDLQKISTYTSTVTSISFGGTVPNTHWRVQWAATANGHGVTEGGSSGSGLFNLDGHLVGTLTGGFSFCDAPLDQDEFGKMSFHWEGNGSTAVNHLSDWLDPDGTGVNKLNGKENDCNPIPSGIAKSNEPPFGFQVMPNPSNGWLSWWYYPVWPKAGIAQVYDLRGKVVHSQTLRQNSTGQLDLTHVSAGLYLLVLRMDQAVYTQKLVIQP